MNKYMDTSGTVFRTVINPWKRKGGSMHRASVMFNLVMNHQYFVMPFCISLI